MGTSRTANAKLHGYMRGAAPKARSGLAWVPRLGHSDELSVKELHY
jgi:hypothetical protein